MGWAGNCGDGGVGGSSWYLVCETCRDKYLQAKKQQTAKKTTRKKNTIIALTMVKASSPASEIPGELLIESQLVENLNFVFSTYFIYFYGFFISKFSNTLIKQKIFI